MRSRWTWLITFAVIALSSSGCAKGVASVHVAQIAPTSLTSRDIIGVAFVGEKSDEGRYAPKVTKCIGRALDGARVEVRNVQVSGIRNVVSGERLGFAEDTSWQTLAADADFQQRAAALGLQYLVAVSVSESTGPATHKTEFQASGNVFGVDITSNRQMLADVRAVVIDLKNARLSARGSVDGKGSSQSGVAMVYLVIPIPHWSTASPFNPACKKLGMGIARALVRWTGDPETVSTCAFVGLARDDNWYDLTKKVLRLKGNTALFPADVDATSLGDEFQPDVQVRVYSCGTATSRNSHHHQQERPATFGNCWFSCGNVVALRLHTESRQWNAAMYTSNGGRD